MLKLQQYVAQYTERGACQCGRCFDAPANPEQHQPTGPHTVDMTYFKISAKPGADAATLKALVQENKRGEFADVDLFDGKPHDFIETGAWIGDQGMALMLMGLGVALGIWQQEPPFHIKATI